MTIPAVLGLPLAFDNASLTCALPLRMPLQQQQCEHEEEYISNRLMKRLETRGSMWKRHMPRVVPQLATLPPRANTLGTWPKLGTRDEPPSRREPVRSGPSR